MDTCFGLFWKPSSGEDPLSLSVDLKADEAMQRIEALMRAKHLQLRTYSATEATHLAMSDVYLREGKRTEAKNEMTLAMADKALHERHYRLYTNLVLMRNVIRDALLSKPVIELMSKTTCTLKDLMQSSGDVQDTWEALRDQMGLAIEQESLMSSPLVIIPTLPSPPLHLPTPPSSAPTTATTRQLLTH